jgi:hypothetical protein
MIIARGRSRYNGAALRVHVTAHSTNTTTGDIPQVWILPDLPGPRPSRAEIIAADAAVCPRTCPHASRDGKPGSCYTHHTHTLLSAPRPGAPDESRTAPRTVARLIPPRPLRLTAYGDLAALDPPTLARMLEVIDHHTADAGAPLGYTAEWRTRPDLRNLCRASTQTAEQTRRARADGWTVYQSPADIEAPDVIPCPNKHSWRPTPPQCVDCRACTGAAPPGQPPIIGAALHSNGARLWTNRT